MAIALVQSVYGSSPSGTTIASASISTTSGHLVIATINPQSGSATSTSVSGVTGGGVTTWTKLKDSRPDLNWDAEIWYGYSTGGSGAVTATVPAGMSVGLIVVSEWSGACASGDPSDVAGVETHGDAGGGSANVDSGAITPTASANVLLICAASAQSGTFATPSGFTQFANGSYGYRGLSAYQLVASASGSYSSLWSTTTDRWGACMVAIKAGAYVPPQVPPISRGILIA